MSGGKDTQAYIYCSAFFIDSELTESRSRPGSTFGSESASFKEIDGKEVFVFVSNFPVQEDPYTAKSMAINDNGAYFVLATQVWSGKKMINFDIGSSAFVTPDQLSKHNKATVMRVPFSASLHHSMMNSEIEIRFAKKDREDVISGITVTIPFDVYRNIGIQLSKLGIPSDQNRFSWCGI